MPEPHQSINDWVADNEPDTNTGDWPVTCRECGTEFESRIKPNGSKWTSLCDSCLRWHL